MNNDWVDFYNGDSSPLGGNPTGFDGSMVNKAPQPQQPQGGSPLSGLAQALLQKYLGGQSGMLGSSSAGTYYPTQYGTSSDPFLGGENPGFGSPPVD